MIRSNSNGSNHASRNSMGLIAISLPGFKPIDLLFNQGTNTAHTNDDDFLLSGEEKENTPEHLSANAALPNDLMNQKTTTTSSANNSKSDYTNNESSNSVPMAQLVMKAAAAESSATANANANATINFVFSPAGHNSFLNTFKNISSSASKISSLKQNTATTPTNNNNSSTTTVRASPRSLKQNSKRKLDLNALLDQMPDKDFVEIIEKPTKECSANLTWVRLSCFVCLFMSTE